MPNHYRHTKIIATVGPSTESRERLTQLISGGVDVIRLNMAHGSCEWVLSLVKSVREVSKEVQRHVAVMMDVKGSGNSHGHGRRVDRFANRRPVRVLYRQAVERTAGSRRQLSWAADGRARRRDDVGRQRFDPA